MPDYSSMLRRVRRYLTTLVTLVISIGGLHAFGAIFFSKHTMDSVGQAFSILAGAGFVVFVIREENKAERYRHDMAMNNVKYFESQVSELEDAYGKTPREPQVGFGVAGDWYLRTSEGYEAPWYYLHNTRDWFTPSAVTRFYSPWQEPQIDDPQVAQTSFTTHSEHGLVIPESILVEWYDDQGFHCTFLYPGNPQHTRPSPPWP
ncbi:hypothetical protein [Pseudoclavibacter helvolus]|uniref:hypothetical protein n=1 Tax=Pseudoclavibacter helvolus TaxID=255205 RepID=UPI000838609B|nr:hypothetical protein [Pseudoclavibacter helvolus]